MYRIEGLTRNGEPRVALFLSDGYQHAEQEFTLEEVEQLRDDLDEVARHSFQSPQPAPDSPPASA